MSIWLKIRSSTVNKKYNHILFGTIVLIQIIAIVGILIHIKVKNSNVLGKSSVNTISNRKIIRTISSKYKYFYELQSNIHDVSKQLWTDVDRQVITTTNSDSMNERVDYAVEKPKNVFRIITLGDSFTYGLNVSTVDNWTEILEQNLNRKYVCKKYDNYEVLNLGVYGYDVNYAVERYRLRGMKYDPDLVVWLIKEDDFIFPEEMIRKTMFEDEKYIESDEDYLEIWNQIFDSIGFESLIEAQTKSLKSIRNYYKKSLLISEMTNYDKVDKVIKKYVEKDPESHLLSFNLDKELTFLDSHPNEKGHQYIADKIYVYLVKNLLINCE